MLVLYVDDILLASTSVHLLKETKAMLNANFEMKEWWNTFCVKD